jgi:hypothetical protein
MIDAKLKGEGIDVSEPAEPDRTNVVDLMSALKKSLAQEAAAPKRSAPRAPASAKAKACRRCSGSQTGPEAGIGWRLLFRWPTLQKDQTTFLWQAYLAEDLLVVGKMT